MALKLKFDEEGHVVVQDGKPVFVDDDGKDIVHDANYTLGTISRLNGENKTFRERAETAEERLKPFEDIEDPDAARAALETVKNLQQGDLVTAGKIKEVQDAAKRAAEEQVAAASKASEQRIAAISGERDGFRDELYSEKIGGAFSRSKFISDKCAIPADLVQARFGPRYKIEDRNIVAYDDKGNKVYSRANPGELAGFEEALELMIDMYPFKEQILKGANQSGGGADHGQGGGRPQPKGNLIGNKTERVEAIQSRFPDLPAR